MIIFKKSIHLDSTVASSTGSDGEEELEDSDSEGDEDCCEDCNNPDEDEDENSRKIAAAAMVVNVGSYHEKPECQGLAHLCEHMISMGSTKYPNENELEQLLSRNSGDSNAFTEAEYTAYHFEVVPDKFQEALDIWAQYFIDPLMKEDSIEREERDQIQFYCSINLIFIPIKVTAVHSEFEVSKMDDDCRREQIIQEAIMKSNHPQANFSWGNRKSLVDDPNAIDKSAHAMLHEWFPRNYSSKIMKLVLQERPEKMYICIFQTLIKL